MKSRSLLAVCVLSLALAACGDDDNGAAPAPTPTPIPTVSALRVGVAAVPLTPCGANPEWDGPITASGVWGETFTDNNGNGTWDAGEPFVDDPVNGDLDPSSIEKYDGIYLAGFGNNRLATGCHDDLWARALVLQGPTRKVALVSVDLVGEMSHGTYYGFSFARQAVDPGLGLDGLIFSSTHVHEAPDTLGLWGEQEFSDGKFPRYLQFVDRQVARAINLAAAPEAMRPATVVAARTDPESSPELLGLQVRTGCRPPWFFDQELRALQFLGEDGQTIATLINWNTHPESLEDENTLVSSDFIHYIRERVERDLGGTAVYFTGDLGAAEIVGDTCVGGSDPHLPDGTNEFDRRDEIGFPRTQRLGELVGDATVKALRAGETLAVAGIDVVGTEYRVAGTNAALSFANSISLLDVDPAIFDPELCAPGTALCVLVEQHLVTLRDEAGQALVQMISVPGELFPELFYGTETFHRTDCPRADTGEPFEPSIRNAMYAPYRLVIGLSPDEFGYIVPGYDFYAPPAAFEEAADPCEGEHYDPAVSRRSVPAHYHETFAVGLDMAPATTCYALRLLGAEEQIEKNAACRRILGTQ